MSVNLSKVFIILIVVHVVLVNCLPTDANAQPKPPNIIYILADDLGYGDLSCYNTSSKIRTTHIDRLAEGGILFTDAHSPSSVCTPTRYGILTGRYAWRTSLKSGVTWSWSEPLIGANQMTVPGLLKKRGYQTACIGKWHLGLGWQKDSLGKVDLLNPISEGPNEVGFDYFYGIAASLDIPPYVYIENHQPTASAIDTIAERTGKEFWRKGPIGNDFTMEDVLPHFTEKALGYISTQANHEQPFFLYFALPAPHTPILPTAKFKGHSETNAYGDFVLMIDDLVGQIMTLLDQKGLTDNTMVVFTSDNGCSPMANFEELAAVGHHPSGPFRGHKADIYEGGHRIPFIVKWPQRIRPGKSLGKTINLTDLLATCAALVGLPLAWDEGVDSYNILPLLTGDGVDEAKREATVLHSINGSFAIRQDNWKLAFCPGSGGWSWPTDPDAEKSGMPPVQLFDLYNDPGERVNVAEHHPLVVKKLTLLMQSYIDNGRSTPGISQSNDTATLLFPNK